MTKIGEHCYIIGTTAKSTLTDEQKNATETNQEYNSVFFSVIQRRHCILFYWVCERARI